MSEITFESVSSEDSRWNYLKMFKDKTSLLQDAFDKFKYIIENVFNIFGSILMVAYLLWTPHCMLKEEVGRSHLTSALFAAAGLSSLILQLFSTKLIISGGTRLGYVLCTLILLDQDRRKCPGIGDIFAMGPHARTLEWVLRLQVVQGAVIVTCLIQMLIATLGIDTVAKYVRPVTVAPTMLFISISVVKTTTLRMAETCWTLFFCTALLMFLSYCVYYFYWCKKFFNIRRHLYVGVTSVIIVWVSCVLLSSMDYVDSVSPARTNIYTGIWNYTSQLRFSYAFQWGIPQWDMDAILLVLPACFVSIVEILASYYNHLRSRAEWAACDDKSKAKIWSKLIMWEAEFCILSSTIGAPLGIDIRLQEKKEKFAGFAIPIILMVIALSGGLCSLFMNVPEPIVATLVLLIFISMLFEGLKVMQCINLKSIKNRYIIGSSMFLAFVIPVLVRNKSDVRITGRPTIDRALLCLLSTQFVVAALVAFILDNLIRVLTDEQKCFTSIHENVDQKEEKKNPGFFTYCITSFVS